MPVTIREATQEELDTLLLASNYKYVVINSEVPEHIYTVFGLIQGGATEEEAVFWAQRLASKNGLVYAPPAGWEFIEGKLPEGES